MTDAHGTSKSLPINPTALAAWLEKIGAPTQGPVTLDRIGNGQSNLTYIVSDEAGHRCVVRRPPLGTLVSSAHNVAREGRIMAALEHTDVPVPIIYGTYQPDEDADGAYGAEELEDAISDAPVVAMSALAGEAITSPAISAGYRPAEREDIARGLISTMVAIHAVDIDDPKVGLGDLAARTPYAQRQLHRWAGQWEKTKTRESLGLDELTRRLNDAIPEQTETVLVHGDLHLGNIMVARRGDAVAAPTTSATAATDNATKRSGSIDVTGVVDWELATLGDPLADLGSLMAYWPERNGIVLPGFSAALDEGFPTADELADWYLEETGRSRDALNFWHILGMWKVAIIAEGVVRRIKDMPANRAPSGAPTTDAVDALIHAALDRADAVGIL